jgi:hypothetical protein
MSDVCHGALNNNGILITGALKCLVCSCWAQDEFEPDDDDCIMARTRTTGMVVSGERETIGNTLCRCEQEQRRH